MATNLFKKTAFLALIIFLSTCKKTEYVPYVPVDIVISENYLTGVGDGSSVEIVPNDNDRAILVLDSARSFVLPDNYVYGNGIYLYKVGYGNYIAYDKTCTYKPTDDYCATKYDKGFEYQNVVVCPCCNSKFLLNNGAAFSEPATIPLKIYNVNVSNGIITILN